MLIDVYRKGNKKRSDEKILQGIEFKDYELAIVALKIPYKQTYYKELR